MVFVFFAHGFEEIEGVTVVDVLKRVGVPVRSVGVGSKTITGAHGITFHCDMMDREIDMRQAKMIVLPGGMPGTTNLEKSAAVMNAINHAAENNLWIGAICAAPSILGNEGLLSGKKAACYPGFEKEMEGAELVAQPVVVDGKYITANGPAAALQFALQLAGALSGKEMMARIASEMQYQGEFAPHE